MKDNILDALLFMFDQVNEDGKVYIDREKMTEALDQVGFSQAEVSQAFSWLDDLSVLADAQCVATASHGAMRYYTDAEQEKLSIENRGFLFELECLGIIDDFSREIIIDRFVALHEGIEWDLTQLKWLVMLVLANLDDREQELAWLEDWGVEQNIH